MLGKSSSQLQDDKGQDMVGNMTQQSVLNAFDFSAIEEMDPSLGKLSQSTHLFADANTINTYSIIFAGLRIICQN